MPHTTRLIPNNRPALKTLKINLFGTFEVFLDEQRLSPFESRKIEELFAYLVLHPRAHSRLRLAAAIWPEKDETKGRTSLRHGLYVLKRALKRWEDYLHVDRRTVAFKRNGNCGLDVACFRQAIEKSRQAQGHTKARCLKRAVALYQGRLMDGFYEDWVLALREKLQGDYVQALTGLIEYHEQQRQWECVVGYAHQILQETPYRESTYGQLMRAHAELGNRGLIHTVYMQCQQALNELDAEPSSRTTTLFEQLTGIISVDTEKFSTC